MDGSPATSAVIRFGVFEIDARTGELRRHGMKVRLPDQSFKILQLLLERAGQVVTREELRQRLWAADTVVEFDLGVNSAVRKLREALDDSAENPRFVETLPRRGYRFIAPVTPANGDQAVSVPGPATTPGGRVRSRWTAGGLVLAVTLATLVLFYERGWWQPGRAVRAEHIGSLAVLPFENLTGDAAQDYFVDGMTDALTTYLAQAGGFDVTSRTSVRRYKAATTPLAVIGRELNVDALLAGAIIRSGHEVRITAQLIHVATDRHLWAKSYEGELRDIVALQQQITRAVADVVQGGLASPGRARSAAAVDPDAYDTYLKGVLVAGRGSYEGFRTAVAYFEEAIAKQNDFAAAYATLAQAQHQLLFVGPLSPRDTMPKAEMAARKALELDDTLAQAHRTLGSILHHFHWRWDEGNREFRRARELSSSSAESYSAGVPALIRDGRFDEAIALSERARSNDPLSFNAHVNVATAYRAAGQYQQALAAIRRAVEINAAEARGHFELGVTFVFIGQLNEAIRELETAVGSARGGNPRFLAYLGYVYAAAGRPQDARRILEQLESTARQQYVSSFGIALIHDVLGEKEPALAAVERAYHDRAVEFAQMSQYPTFKTIASEPRFQAVLQQIGLPR